MSVVVLVLRRGRVSPIFEAEVVGIVSWENVVHFQEFCPFAALAEFAEELFGLELEVVDDGADLGLALPWDEGSVLGQITVILRYMDLRISRAPAAIEFRPF